MLRCPHVSPAPGGGPRHPDGPSGMWRQGGGGAGLFWGEPPKKIQEKGKLIKKH